MEKRIRAIRTVHLATINVKEGTLELLPKEGKHIEIDAVKKTIENTGFTPRGIQVALIGKLAKWNDKAAFSLVSTDRNGKKIETKYLLKKNEQFKKLSASAKLPGGNVFIAGKAVKENPDADKDHPYTIIIDKFVVLPKEKR